MEEVLMATVLNCVSSGWLMLAAGLLIDGVLIFAGIRLFKRLSPVKRG